MARPSDLESRLTAILDSRIRRRSAGSAPLLATLLAGAALALPLATLRAQTPDAHAPVEIEAAIRAARSQKNFDLLDQAAAAALRSREFDSARRLLDAALELRADAGGGKGSALYAAGLVRLGELERWQARDSAAETRFQEALAITKEGPDAFRALTALGAGRIAQEDFNTAADYFERAGRAAPVRAALAKMWLAVVRERQNNLPEADALFQSARALAGEESADAVVIARVHSKYLSRQHRPDEAAEAAAFASRALQSNPMPQASGNVYRVGGEVKPPKLLSKVEPEYSIEARSAKHEGMSKLVAEIGVDGRARNIRVLTPLGLFLDEKAMDAIAQWRFEPGTRNGVPVTVLATIEVNFRLL